MRDQTPELAKFRNRFFSLITEGITEEAIATAITFAIIAILGTGNILVITMLYLFIFYPIFLTLDFLNNVFLAKFTNGKSIGKSIFNVRILKEDYSSAKTPNLFKHWFLLSLIGILLSSLGVLINYLVMRKSLLKQGIHNTYANTIVVKSKTARWKRLVLVVTILIIFALSCLVFTISSISIASNYIRENANSLSGVQGPLATIPEETLFGKGYLNYQKAIEYTGENKFEDARSMIDTAFIENPESIQIMTYRCYVYTMLNEYEAAYNVCELIYKKTPNNPNVIANQLENAYYIDECEKVNELAIALSNMRIGLDFTNETKSIYYGNAGINLTLCQNNPGLAKKMLNAAISLSSNLQDQTIYENYLDNLYDAMP